MKEVAEILAQTGITIGMFNRYKAMGLVSKYSKKTSTPGKSGGGFKYYYENKVIDEIHMVRKKCEAGISLPQQQREKWEIERTLSLADMKVEHVKHVDNEAMPQKTEEEAQELLDTVFEGFYGDSAKKDISAIKMIKMIKLLEEIDQIWKEGKIENKEMLVKIKKDKDGNWLAEHVCPEKKKAPEVSTSRALVKVSDEDALLNNLKQHLIPTNRERIVVKAILEEVTRNPEKYIHKKAGKK